MIYVYSVFNSFILIKPLWACFILDNIYSGKSAVFWNSPQSQTIALNDIRCFWEQVIQQLPIVVNPFYLIEKGIIIKVYIINSR